MDILKEIERQIKSIKIEENSSYLDQIYIHLDRAESYYKQGQQDDNYFNDVIYRSNQAYEGALKEAYKVLASKSDDELSKTSPHRIEKHFKENQIFKDRVLQLFENYRQEWRNKSTHDYKLVFDENEAFIALMNVTSFVHLLLKQIQERIAFNKEQLKLQNEKQTLQQLRRIVANEEYTMADKIINLLHKFSANMEIKQLKSEYLELEVTGMLHGFLSQAFEGLSITSEPVFRLPKQTLIPDFLLEYNNEKIVLEVKRFSDRTGNVAVINQVISYLEAAQAEEGIIYFINPESNRKQPLISGQSGKVGEKDYNIHVFIP